MNSVKPIKIMLVEDNPADVELTTRALDKGQITNDVVIARDGQEALDILANRSEELPGLILLDLNLPRVNGLEVLAKIKNDEELKKIAVIVLTTSTREEDVVRSYDLGVNTFISKPVSFDDFIKVVTTLKEYWIVIATLPPNLRSTGRQTSEPT